MGEGMTSFSDLPEKLVRRILFSYWTPTNPFTDRKSIRLSLVSTQFYDLMQNPPVLNFGLGMEIANYLKYSLSTLIRYEEENIHLDSLTMEVLYQNLCDDCDSDVLDECIKLGARKRLTNLVLSLHNTHRVLPEAVFKIESLERLHLSFCQLKPERTPMWPNLRELSLYDFRMNNEEAFENLIKGCPLIETLIMDEYDWGRGRFNFKISNLRSLKKLSASLGSDHSIDLRESASTNLESIHSTPYSKRHPVITLGKHAYPILKRLDLRKVRVLDDELLSNCGCKFPRLKYLSMGPCFTTPKINLSSSSLKELCLYVNKDVLEEACFDVPNIVSFKFRQKCLSTATLPKLLFTDRSGLGRRCKSEIEPEEGSFEALIRCKYIKEVKFLNQDKYWIADLAPAGFVTGIWKFTILIHRPYFSSSLARPILDTIFMIYRPHTITFIYNIDPYEDDGGDCVNHDIKCELDANSTRSPSDEILELLQPHENMKTRFHSVFNMKYYGRSDDIYSRELGNG